MAVNSLRLPGLASGVDTDTMVKAMLGNQQLKIDKQKQQQTLLEWKRDAWKDMNSAINTFYSKYISPFRLQSTFIQNKVAVSNSAAVEVSTKGNIPTGTHTVEIQEIASGAYMKNAKLTGESKVTGDTTLGDLGVTEGTTIIVERRHADGSLKQGTEIKFDVSQKLWSSVEGDNTVAKVLKEAGVVLSISEDKTINLKGIAEGEGEYFSIKVINGNGSAEEFKGDSDFLSKMGFSGSVILKTDDKGIKSKDFSSIDKNTRLALIDGMDKDGRITLNGIKVELSEIGTIGELESALRAADSSINVNFDVIHQRFFVASKLTGASAKIDIKAEVKVGGEPEYEVKGEVLELLGLKHDDNVLPGENDTLQGKNAKYFYNGITETFESESNTITINGMTMTFKEKTAGPVTIITDRDGEATVGFVKEFVEAYNKLIEDMNTKLNADRARKYTPLTDEQKESMKDSDIEVWEKKIKDALFVNDPQLKALRDSMRGILQDFENSRDTYKSLSSIGITTGNWKELGKLHVDEDKLREAITNNPDAVAELFTGKVVNGQIAVKGIGTKLNEYFQSAIRGISNVKSYSSFYHDIIDREKLVDVGKQIDTLQDRYTRLETTYYAKFTAMEKIMSQLNSQSSWLAQQLGGM